MRDFAFDFRKIPTAEDLEKLTELDRGRWLYKSNSGKQYLIERGPNRIQCACWDYSRRRNGVTTCCKHIGGGSGEIGAAAILGWKEFQRLQAQEQNFKRPD